MIIDRAIYGTNCYGYNCNSNWTRWGRWILAGILIFIGICVLLFVLVLNRRRRGRGMGRIHPRIGMGGRPNQAQAQPPPPQFQAPYGGGGGMGGGGMYNQEQGMAGQAYTPPSGPPPQYGAGSNADYYGQTPEVSQPPNSYQPAQVK